MSAVILPDFFRDSSFGLGYAKLFRNQPVKMSVQSLGCDFGHGNAREATDSQLRLTP
jgi:hypothetical protein